MLTRKHFEALATIVADERTRARALMISDERAGGMLDACEAIAWELTRYLAEQNPNFDRARFIEACKPKEGT